MFFFERLVDGRTYRVAADSVWDPRTKQPVSRQVLLGPADPAPVADLARTRTHSRSDLGDAFRQRDCRRHAMLLVEQNAEMALSLADRVYVIDHGTIVFAGPPAELRASHQVPATYLGVGG